MITKVAMKFVQAASDDELFGAGLVPTSLFGGVIGGGIGRQWAKKRALPELEKEIQIPRFDGATRPDSVYSGEHPIKPIDDYQKALTAKNKQVHDNLIRQQRRMANQQAALDRARALYTDHRLNEKNLFNNALQSSLDSAYGQDIDMNRVQGKIDALRDTNSREMEKLQKEIAGREKYLAEMQKRFSHSLEVAPNEMGATINTTPRNEVVSILNKVDASNRNKGQALREGIDAYTANTRDAVNNEIKARRNAFAKKLNTGSAVGFGIGAGVNGLAWWLAHRNKNKKQQ